MWGRLFFGYFLLAKQKKVTRPKAKSEAVESPWTGNMKFRLYRYNPESGEQPFMQDVELDIEPAGKMLLDALLAIKAQDETLSLAPFLPRGRVRVGRGERQRQEPAGVHHAACPN